MKPASKLELRAETSQFPITLSIVIPVFNEKDIVEACYERVHKVAESIGERYEIVFVDDGSTDGTSRLLSALAYAAKNVRVVQLTRNFGKEAALTAGIDHATGAAIVVLDADLQDPPELIPQMVSTWSQGYDVVCMKRKSRAGESWARITLAHIYYRLLNSVSEVSIPEDVGDFRLMSRRAVEALSQLSERNRYMKGIFAWIGMRTIVIDYDRDPRIGGTSKWGFLRLLGLAAEGITSFSAAPLRWVTGVGMVAASAGGIFGLWIVTKAMLFGDPVAGFPTTVALLSFFGGLQMLGIGLMGEYIGKIYIESKKRPIYLVDKVEGPRSVQSFQMADQPQYALHVASN